MSKRTRSLTALSSVAVALVILTCETWSQGRLGRGGRSPGHSGPNASRPVGTGPAMTRPVGKDHAFGKPNGPGHALNKPGGNVATSQPGGRLQKPGEGTLGSRNPGGGFQRPPLSNRTPPHAGDLPNLGAGKTKPGGDRPNLGGDSPKLGGNHPDRNGIAGRNGSGSSPSLNDFLGREDHHLAGNARPGRPEIGQGDRPRIGGKNVGDRTKIGGRDNSPNVKIGDVNIGNDYSTNQKAWVDNRHTTGNVVRANAGNRYANVARDGAYRRGAVGGYSYYNGWNTRGDYYGWKPASYAAVGSYLGATWANAQPQYYAYGTGGNVFYEGDTVYVNGQKAGTADEYLQQALALVAAAPSTVTNADWMPVGTFAFTREDVDDSQAMLELAVNKQGVVGGTYYNEATGVSRPLKGTVDQASQRVAIGFADGQNADVVLETSIYNLTQEEAPGLLHQGRDRSTAVLLVRLEAPHD